MIAETLALVLDAEALARVGGAIGHAARERQREIAKLDEKASRAMRASWLASARVPLTPGMRGIHGSWIEAAITRAISTSATSTSATSTSATSTSATSTSATSTSESIGALAMHARRVVADGPTSAADVWLARWVCAAFPPMPAIDANVTRPRSIREATTMSSTALRAWLEEVGADQIAFAVGKAATAMESRLGAAAVRIAKAPRLGEMGERRAAIERARIAIDERALVRVGARTIAGYASGNTSGNAGRSERGSKRGSERGTESGAESGIESGAESGIESEAGSGIERLQIAYRLPRELGLVDEMDAFAGAGGAPSWRALSAS